MISLISQSKSHINIEIIKDSNNNSAENNSTDEMSENHDQEKKSTLFQSLKSTFKTKPENQNDQVPETHAFLDYLVNISVKKELINSSEVVWINNNQLILTLNNDFCLVNLKQRDLTNVKGKHLYGVQQVNMNMFCSIIRQRTKKKHSSEHGHSHEVETKENVQSEEYLGKKASMVIIEA